MGGYDMSFVTNEPLVGDLNKGAGNVCLGTRDLWEIILSSPQFYYEPKTSFKTNKFALKMQILEMTIQLSWNFYECGLITLEMAEDSVNLMVDK